jgi:hypothetical protein
VTYFILIRECISPCLYIHYNSLSHSHSVFCSPYNTPHHGDNTSNFFFVVKSYVVKKKHLTFAHYVECLNNNLIKSGNQNLIRSKFHKLYTINQCKILLIRGIYIESNGIDTLPWGHYSLR